MGKANIAIASRARSVGLYFASLHRKSSQDARAVKYVVWLLLAYAQAQVTFLVTKLHEAIYAGSTTSLTIADLSSTANASTIISSPVVGILPELTPDDEQQGILLFLLQVSGPSAVYGNSNLNWALSVNLATRLNYVTVDNLYLLNYTQIPLSTRRRLLQLSPASTPEATPSSIGEVQASVVPLPDLQQDAQNLSVEGTGIYTTGPSMTFMYEVEVADTSYVSYIHNQLNSIIATSVLLSDVQAANLSITSIYLISFEPKQSPTSANTTSDSSLASTDPGWVSSHIA